MTQDFANDPLQAGDVAGPSQKLGTHYILFPVHTRFQHVHWYVQDTETFQIVRRETDLKKAVEGLGLVS